MLRNSSNETLPRGSIVVTFNMASMSSELVCGGAAGPLDGVTSVCRLRKEGKIESRAGAAGQRREGNEGGES